ncbi:glycosyltransferase 2 [Colletotrichum tofieldiae]|nr:glycosyltransferase 2 [Colletotrichum tofieldiae]
MPDPWRQLRSLVFLSDEEMGKKDDDHHRAGGSAIKNPILLRNRNPQWQPAAKMPSRRLFRRVAYLFLIACALWYLLSDLSFGFGERPPSYIYPYPDDPRESRDPTLRKTGRLPKGQPPPQGTEHHDYNGPVKFHRLASSLHAIAATKGSQPVNQNVLFAASNLRSLSTLLPFACKMGTELRSYVHFAVMSRSDMDLDDLKKINGVDDTCYIIWHDARADFSTLSTDARLEQSALRALRHIHTYMHPQAIIVDGSDDEYLPFTKGMRDETGRLNTPLIELPLNAWTHLSWLAKLDSASLSVWNQVSVDILIQAPASGSGSLLRLLKSLNEVDFTAFTIPHLTIELPQDIEPATAKFLETFHWPPPHVQNPGRVQMLSLRHRIPRQRMTEEESSIRFLESFWPTTPRHSHILVLSPQAELAPGFFHCGFGYATDLKYTMLEYRYSRLSTLQKWDQRILGISMASPSTYLNGKIDFVEPTAESAKDGEGTSYLWQAPNSNAMLIFGDRWIELHGLVSEVDALQHARGADPPPELVTEKEVSKKFPSWLEHVLRLSRLRGYFTLYPSAETAATLATVHRELYQAPEEYEKEGSERKKTASLSESAVSFGSLVQTLDTLPNNGSLAPANDLPLLGWEGEGTNLRHVYQMAVEYMFKWREQVGGCSKEESQRDHIDGSAKDLFCTADGKFKG